jgi:hypothetical protein
MRRSKVGRIHPTPAPRQSTPFLSVSLVDCRGFLVYAGSMGNFIAFLWLSMPPFYLLFIVLGILILLGFVYIWYTYPHAPVRRSSHVNNTREALGFDIQP